MDLLTSKSFLNHGVDTDPSCKFDPQSSDLPALISSRFLRYRRKESIEESTLVDLVDQCRGEFYFVEVVKNDEGGHVPEEELEKHGEETEFKVEVYA